MNAIFSENCIYDKSVSPEPEARELLAESNLKVLALLEITPENPEPKVEAFNTTLVLEESVTKPAAEVKPDEGVTRPVVSKKKSPALQPRKQCFTTDGEKMKKPVKSQFGAKDQSQFGAMVKPDGTIKSVEDDDDDDDDDMKSNTRSKKRKRSSKAQVEKLKLKLDLEAPTVVVAN